MVEPAELEAEHLYVPGFWNVWTIFCVRSGITWAWNWSTPVSL